MKRSSRTSVRVLVVRLLAIGTLLASSFGLGLTSVASADSAAPAAPLKPQVAVPPTAHNAIARPDAAKALHNAITPAIAWSAGLSASSTSLWPTQYTTLTATANQDVGPTPYYLSIYDQTAHSYVAICGFGTTCATSVTQATATTHSYQAYVSYYPTANPPSGVQATSGVVSVTWRGISVSVSASPTTLAVGSTTTVTATTSADVGPTPFYTELYDATTSTRIGVCGGGTSCSTTASQSVATTHRYVAYVSSYSTAFPPAGIQATSASSYVTWSYANYRVSLTASRTSYGHDTVTATTNVNVGPTPYYIEIFSETTGARVAVCGTGTSCSANVALNFGNNNFVAFVSSYDSALPPANVQASSNVVTDWFFPIFL